MNKKIKIKNSAYVLGIIGLLSFGVLTSVKISIMGSRLHEIEAEIENMSKFNREIQMKMIETSSLSRVSELAPKIGMRSAENLIYLSTAKAGVGTSIVVKLE